MANANQIKAKLLEMEGGAFQRLCDDWLHKKGYKNLYSTGMMAATNKVVKGTPDSLIIHEDGKYIVAEYTTKAGFSANKLEADINKCFDENKTGISTEDISELILCYQGRLSSTDINKLAKICCDKSVKLTQFGIDPIALSIQNDYPTLAEQHLNLSLDTGQLLQPDDFIKRYGKNKLTTPIDNVLLFQDEKISHCISLLEERNVLIVTGPAGVGKTIFCVNLAQQYEKKYSKVKTYCVFDKGADLITDLTSRLSEPGDYLIFADDANRLDNRIDYLLHYLNESDSTRTFKMIASVRGYAKNCVVDKVRGFSKFQEIEIRPLSDAQIRSFIEINLGIKNQDYQDRIIEISSGSPRLAYMASEVVKKSKKLSSISDVASLYKEYFEFNDRVKETIDNDHLMRVVCAVSFFRRVDKNNDEQSKLIEDTFGVPHSEFWESIRSLYQNEIVDLYDDEFAKISDQVLSTYLFYIAVFKDKIVPFSIVLNSLYPKYNRRILDSLKPALNSFDYNKTVSIIREDVTGQFNCLKSDSREDTLSFLNIFWFALPTESLTFVKNLIDQYPQPNIVWENKEFEDSNYNKFNDQIVNLLSVYRNQDEERATIALELMLRYLERNNDALESVIQSLTVNFKYKIEDAKFGYRIQDMVINKLYDRMDMGANYLYTKLFLLVATAFIAVTHTESRSRNGSLSTVDFKVHPGGEIERIRGKIFEGLSQVVNNEQYSKSVYSFFERYILQISNSGKDIITGDIGLWESHIFCNYSVANPSHCLLVRDLVDKLNFIEVSYPEDWNKKYESKFLELSKHLIPNLASRRLRADLGHQKSIEDYEEQFSIYLLGKSRSDIQEIFVYCKSLHDTFSGNSEISSMRKGLGTMFRSLTKTHSAEFVGIVSDYVQYDDCLSVLPHDLIEFMVTNCGTNETILLIESYVFKRKNYWLSICYAQLSEKSIDKDIARSMLEHLHRIDENSVPDGIDFLENYKSTIDDVYVKVGRMLLEKGKENIRFIVPLSKLFNINIYSFNHLVKLFSSDRSIIVDAYLQSLSNIHDFDYSGDWLKIMINYEEDFLIKVIDVIYDNQDSISSQPNIPDLKFLWDRDSYHDDIECYAKYAIEKESDRYRIFGDSIFTILFDNQQKLDEETEKRKESFLKKSLRDNIKNIDYICCVFEASTYMSLNFRVELVSLFLSLNRNIEHFKSIQFQFSSSFSSGSRVPYIEKERAFLTKILPNLSSMALLEHNLYIEQLLDSKAKDIQLEKKRDFLNVF